VILISTQLMLAKAVVMIAVTMNALPKMMMMTRMRTMELSILQ
jgi:hypothetical protein